MNFYEDLPRYSYLKSRLSYLIIFLKCFFPLRELLHKEKPKFLDVFQGLDPTCVATLPWQYFLGTLYKDDREMKFCNLNFL